MKKIVLLISLFCLSTGVCFSQKSNLPVKSNVSKQTSIQPLKEIPDAEWKILVDAVRNEKWEKSRLLAREYLTKIRGENDKKQSARLRYVLLYALAGKIVESSLTGKKPEEDKARIELEKTTNSFVEKEFFVPSRQISAECQAMLNYICRSKQQKNVLRVTATNLERQFIRLNM